MLRALLPVRLILLLSLPALAALAAAATPVRASAASTSAGRPWIRELSPAEFPTSRPVYKAAHAPDGLLYFTSMGCVLEYDGHRVRELPLPDPIADALVGSLAFDERGRIFFTTLNYCGVLERDAQGSWTARLLNNEIPLPAHEVRGFQDVAADRGGVYFATAECVIRWHDGGWTVFPLPAGKRAAGCVADGADVWVQTRGNELFRIGPAGLEFVAVLGGAGFQKIVGLDRRADGRLRLVLSSGAVVVVGNDGVSTLWTTEPATSAAPLPGGGLAVATRSAGLVFFDAEGHPFAALDPDVGLPSGHSLNLLAGGGGRLWVVAASTIAVIDGLPAATRFDRLTGLRGSRVAAIARYGGALHVSTDAGVYRLESRDGNETRFRLVDGLENRSSALLVTGDALLAGGRDGVYALSGGRFIRVATTTRPVNTLAMAPGWNSFVYYGTNEGLGGLRRTAGGWADEGLHEAIGEVWSLAAPTADSFWIGRARRIVAHATQRLPDFAQRESTGEMAPLITVRQAGAFTSQFVFRAFLGDRRLPPGTDRLRLTGWNGDVFLAAEPGLFRYDPKTDRFVETAKTGWPDGYRVTLLAPTSPERAWVVLQPADSGDQAAAPAWRVAEIARDGALLRLLPASVLGGVAEIVALFHEDGPEGETLWVGGHDALVHIALDRLPPPEPAPRVVLRASTPPASAGNRFSTDTDRLRFHFAAPNVIGQAVAYQARIGPDGHAWSAFESQPHFDLPQPTAGAHEIAFRARNADGVTGPETVFAFTVLPPWWWSPWACAGYALALLGGVAGLVRWRLATVRRRNAELERTVRERTEKLRASEQNLLVAKEAAEAASRAKSAFLTSMSHELRTPLNAILGYTQLMRRGCPAGDPNQRRLELVARSGEHLLQLITDLLDLSRIEAGRIDLRTRPCSLRRLLGELAETFQARAAQKGLGFSHLQPGPLPEWVLADEHRLRQVLGNLLGNAVKFTERGEVMIIIAPVAGSTGCACVRFEVRDTGIGIAAGDLPRIFAPFQQAASPALSAQGVGLGLAISERLVQLMGGRLCVESEPGRGSRFWFDVVLPAAAAPAAETVRVVTGYRGERRRLLVVDDEAANRELLLDLLGGLGFAVTVAAERRAALAACAEETFAAVLLDLRLPGTDGFELAPLLRTAGGPRLRILALSASVFPVDREQALAAGCDEFLPKPVDETALLDALGRLLGIEWSWAQDNAAPGQADEGGTPWESLPVPPAGVLDELLRHIDGGDAFRLEQKLRALRAGEPRLAPFADRLAALLADYRMTALSDVVRRARDRSGTPVA